MAIKRKISEEKTVAELDVNTKRKKWEEITESDRLSDLPESLQLRILASLDAKHAVQTALLSRTWVSLWTRIPVLEFNQNSLKKLPAFDKFVINVLGRRDQSDKLEILRFNRDGVASAKILNSVFDYVFSNGVKQLDVYIKESRNNTWPPSLTGSFESLTNLKLQSQKSISFPFLGPRSILFKNLKVLYLKHAIITDHESFSGFPALESLTLVNCHLSTKSLRLDSRRLSELTISSYEGINGCELTTPRLRFLKYRGPEIPVLISHGGLPVLETVAIDLTGYYSNGQEKKMFDDLMSLFSIIHNVKSLKIFSSVVKLLSLHRGELEKRCSPFWELKDLKMDCRWWFEDFGVSFVKDYLVQNCPDAKLTFIYPEKLSCNTCLRCY